MTLHAQRKIVRNITLIGVADVGPLKVSLHSFRNFLESAMHAVVGFAHAPHDPCVLRTVRSFFSTPKIVLLAAISQSKTFLGAILNIIARPFGKKSLVAGAANDTDLFVSSDFAARHGTVQVVFPLDAALKGKKLNVTNGATQKESRFAALNSAFARAVDFLVSLITASLERLSAMTAYKFYHLSIITQ